MKKAVLKSILYFIIGFVLFFGFRLIYGYSAYPDGEEEYYNTSYYYNDYYYQDNTSFEFNRNNYASSKYEYKKMGGNTPQVTTVDQKYEKIATATSTSGDYDNDETKIREAIKKHNSIIQFEQKSGLTNYRSLNLAIGVPPEEFDSMVKTIEGIGSLKSLNISKTDKTNEYKELQAKRISLEKTRDALIELKAHGGSIEERVNLENQILEIEQQIQDLGVSLGDFDDENEFCTIKLSLSESYISTVTISFIERAKVALEWTVKYYGITILIFLHFVLIFWVGAMVIRYIKKVDQKSEKKA